MGNVEIPKWLKGLPLAPEFRPTDTEFADPIAYISKIEKEASAFGICKVIPPLPKPSKRYVFSNLNKTLSKCPELGDNVDLSNACSSSKMGGGDCANEGEIRAVFTTRHQELGQSVKRTKGVVKENPPLGVHKQVWQSGEIYTLEQFESKSKAFARSMLGMLKDVNPLVIEALFWKASSEKPIYVEYANDVPGSAFGEPEGQFRYFHKRRRKRASYQSYRRRSSESSDCKTSEMNIVKDFHYDEMKNVSLMIEPSTSLETTPRSSITSTTSFLEETSKSSKRKSVNVSNDMEGTAGWKLSNSPWNLQVIARAPGSLTRFMPDDIPGVTSPMVYIGMLFSWFAWHVEDHELHSLNFLHTGSPKTWYAVPGDYAYAFEEVIRSDAYGGDVDRLAALTLLGEKTTLMSPEVVVSSGIPCCRLIQNPGEFVVTFPRAYHIGFSHGFNCGEAANFGTPQWLNVAKEAAVRRAAMNYLPMLSHQQLLYLLTMSFASRVPRYLLPGARSSRLRDRQREEREWSVKKAFIEDLLKDNDMVSLILGKDSTCRVVVWNPDLLPCASKESQFPSATNTVATHPSENVSNIHPECNSESSKNDLYKEMSLYMETLNDLYLNDDDDDLSSDFQVDSGTLGCVACGILGFPFMSVVQPSERATIDLLPVDIVLVQEGTEGARSENGSSSADSDGTLKGSVSGNVPQVPNLSFPLKDLPMPSGWNTSSKFVRPRIFCLEHGFQTKDLLQSKGGANMLIICHSDYQKMKAHATVIAEEINIPFNYNEAQLESASQEDLNLIDLAIDDEDHDECGEDWTSELGINLRYCVKVRKNSPSKQVQHALVLGGLLSDKSPASKFLNIKWKARKSRTRIKSNQPVHFNPCNNIEITKDEILRKKSDGTIVGKEEKLIQYTRRKFKVKIDCSTSVDPRKHLEEKFLGASCEFHDKHTGKISSSSHCGDVITESGSAGLPFVMSEILHEVQVLEETGSMSLNSAPLQVMDSLLNATLVAGSTVEQIENQPSAEPNENGNVGDVAVCNSSEMQNEIKANGGSNEIGGDCYAIKSSDQHVRAADKRLEMQVGHPVTENVSIKNEACNPISKGQQKVISDGDFTRSEVSDLSKVACLHATQPLAGQMDNVEVVRPCPENHNDHDMTSDNEANEEQQNSTECKCYQSFTCNDTQINQPTVLVKEKCELLQGPCDGEHVVQTEVLITRESSKEEYILGDIIVTRQPTLASANERNTIPGDPCSAENLCNGVTSKNDMQVMIQNSRETNEEFVSCSTTLMEIDQPTASLVKNVSEVLRRTASNENLCSTSTWGAEVVTEIPTINRSDATSRQEDHTFAVLTGNCSEGPKNCASEDSSSGVNLDTAVQQELQSRDGVSTDDDVNKKQQTGCAINGDTVSGHAITINQPFADRIQKVSCASESMSKGNEGPSSSKPESNEEPSVNEPESNEEPSLNELESIKAAKVDTKSASGTGRKRKNELEHLTESNFTCNSFIRSPCEGLRPRGKDAKRSGDDIRKPAEENPATKRARKQPDVSIAHHKKKENAKRSYKCDLEGCHMSFETKAELMLHKRNRCPYEGCRKRFSSHKYAIIHQRVHEDDRPLKCPWEGCSMSFKWAWARTEHIRVHTGEKPYQCKVEGCGLSFRFVSDFSRHRRKTGHNVNTAA